MPTHPPFRSFQDESGYLLGLVREAYPEALLERRRARLRRFWARKPAEGRLPYVVWDMRLRQEWPASPPEYTPLQHGLIWQLRVMAEHAAWDDDFLPTFSPGLVQATIPAYFGAVEMKTDQAVKVVPMIPEEEPGKAWSLPEIGYPPDSHGGRLLASMRYMRQLSGGALPISEADMQGPVSVAGHLWDVQGLLTAFYAAPDAVRHLLGRTAQAVIAFLRLMREAVDGHWSPCHCFPCIWMPPDAGVCLSEDLLAVISPDSTREFMNPALDQVGREFGGVLAHTCGNLLPAAPALAESQTVFGVNCSSSETDILKLAERTGSRFCYIIHHSGARAGVNDPGLPALDLEGQARLCREAFSDRLAGLPLLSPGRLDGDLDPARDGDRLRRALEI